MPIDFDYHIHTSYCNHANGSIDDYIKRGIELNFREILFLDHLTLSEPDFKNSMTPKEVPLYFYSVKNSAEKFKDKIIVKCGLEIDFHPDFFQETERICDQFDFDMLGASVHFAEGYNLVSRRKRHEYNHLTGDDLIFMYLDNMEKMLEYDFFNTICHFDVIFKFSPQLHQETMKKAQIKIKHLLDIIAEKNICLEINTSGFFHPVNRQYPHPEILRECAKRGISIVPASDSHSPMDLGRKFSEAARILKQAGIKKLTTFSKREKYEQAYF